MKKRLSDGTTLAVCAGVIYVALAFISIVCFRILTTEDAYSFVPGEIPVVRVPLNDPTEDESESKKISTLNDRTPIVVLTRDAFLFGNSLAFAGELTNVRNKFSISHVEGQPQLPKLLVSIKEWSESSKDPITSDVVVFAPTEEIPMPIIIQVMAALRDHSPFKRVILATGVI